MPKRRLKDGHLFAVNIDRMDMLRTNVPPDELRKLYVKEMLVGGFRKGGGDETCLECEHVTVETHHDAMRDQERLALHCKLRGRYGPGAVCPDEAEKRMSEAAMALIPPGMSPDDLIMKPLASALTREPFPNDFMKAMLGSPRATTATRPAEPSKPTGTDRIAKSFGVIDAAVKSGLVSPDQARHLSKVMPEINGRMSAAEYEHMQTIAYESAQMAKEAAPPKEPPPPKDLPQTDGFGDW